MNLEVYTTEALATTAFKKQVIIVFFVYVAYLIIGGCLFVMIERENEVESLKRDMDILRLARSKLDLLVNNNSDVGIILAASAENISDTETITAFKMKHIELKNSTTKHDKLENFFGDKFFFSVILITTVGYGDTAPSSEIAQVVCIIYIFLGIPLHAVLMRLLGLKFHGGFRWIFRKTKLLLNPTQWGKFLTGIFYYGLWISLFFFIPSVLFRTMEYWTYSQALYFCFVSLSTIGLGDLVAGLTSHHLNNVFYAPYLLTLSSWIIFGVTFVSSMLDRISYYISKFIFTGIESKCRKMAEAQAKIKPISNFMAELNWNLAKYTPKGFENWKDLEDFETLCLENPHHVTPEILKNVNVILDSLKEKTNEELSSINLEDEQTELPLDEYATLDAKTLVKY
ncbi:potassium channel subfamily K member 16-like [Uloborus diversus]|uniref:potassium channel subfamily K member 16-like n=1 Tax=Uloborus diversus TaxID=327109 RepID=UPI002409EA62|nr:potassium channel subfamily K member 16-like [Uloborus diversus]